MGELGHSLPMLPPAAPQAAHSLDGERGAHSRGMIKNSTSLVREVRTGA